MTQTNIYGEQLVYALCGGEERKRRQRDVAELLGAGGFIGSGPGQTTSRKSWENDEIKKARGRRSSSFGG